MSTTPEFDLSRYLHLMNGAVFVLKKEFSGLQTGRASVNLIDHVSVNIYGARMPINQLATVSVPEPRMIAIHVWDRSQVDAVVRAIRESNLGLNPVVEGAVMRLPIPELSQDRRRDLAKVAHKYSEQSRIAVRHVRRDAMDRLKHMEKKHLLSKDEHSTKATEIQKITNETIAVIDKLLVTKESEIMRV